MQKLIFPCYNKNEVFEFMNLDFLPVHFFIEFASPVFIDTYPIFVLRSMLGKNLHSISCIAHSNDCVHCLYNKTCAYAYIFETIIPQKNDIQPGINRASHPFAFTRNTKFNFENKQIKTFDFEITLFGKAIEYLPYIYASFVRAGNDGLFKSRTQFCVRDIKCCNKSILRDSDK